MSKKGKKNQKKQQKQQIFLEEMADPQLIAQYEAACQEVVARLEKINADISQKKGWTFIKEISYRIKSPMSCFHKMMTKGYALKVQTACEQLNDIAGVRAVCYFLDDVYQLEDILQACPEYELVKRKDYVTKPKASGYQSLHLIVKVPVGEQMVKTEIQIRTKAMDFWSDIEHHFIYKTEKEGLCEEEFLKCSRALQKVDKQMLKIRNRIQE